MHDENYHITKNSPILTIKCIVQGKNKNIKTKKMLESYCPGWPRQVWGKNQDGILQTFLPKNLAIVNERLFQNLGFSLLGIIT